MAMPDPGLYRLMAWLSPAYPVGAFSYSHGLEYAVEAGLLGGVDDLRGWLREVLERGAGRADAVLFAVAHRAAQALDEAALRGVAEFGAALRPSAEIALETAAQGAAFLRTTREVWPAPALDLLARCWEGPAVYPVAVGAAAGGHGLDLTSALEAYLHAFAANLVSAGVRLIPLGQTDGQRVTAALEPVVRDLAADAPGESLDDIGTAVPMVEWCSMKHEEQYTRLFRS
jgi:urease accessory protein